MILQYEPKKVLEFGCNTGRNLKALEELVIQDGVGNWMDLYGIDQNEEAIRNGKKNYVFPGMIHLTIADEKYLDILIKGKSHFDVIFTVSVLDHNYRDDAEKILQKLDALASKALILVEPQHYDHTGLVIEGSMEHLSEDMAPYTFSWDYEMMLPGLEKTEHFPIGTRDWGKYYHLFKKEKE